MNHSDDDSEREFCQQDAGTPLCVFYFSHPFKIVSDDESTIPPAKSNTSNKNFSMNLLPLPDPVPRRRHNRTAIGSRRPTSRRTYRRGVCKKRSPWTLVRYLTEAIQWRSYRTQLPCLEDVVNTLRAGWQQDNDFVNCYSNTTNERGPMATHFDSSKEKPSSGFPSPVLMRRRLSAPETIMRKHMLNQQRSDSTESDSTPTSSISPIRRDKMHSFWNNRSSTTGSESNLSRKQYKRDPDLMRKSTLLRRMWSREFTGSITRLYNDDAFPKRNSFPMKQSTSRSPVRSLRSSPEHLANREQRNNPTGSPERMRMARSNLETITVKSKWDPNNHQDLLSISSRSRMSSTSESNKSMLETSSADLKVSTSTTVSTENDSSFTISTRTTTTTTTNTGNVDDNSNNSDSAYTNSTQTYSTYSSPKSNPESNNNEKPRQEEPVAPKQAFINNLGLGLRPERGQFDKQSTRTPDLNSNHDESNDQKWSNHRADDASSESVPKIDEQTAELNIVNLSAATLNIIINNSSEVNNTVQENISRIAERISDISSAVFVPEATASALPKKDPESTENLQQTPNLEKHSFYLQQRNNDGKISADHSRLIKYMISNVGAGSSYSSKPTENPQLAVPRYSALPRSVSMEVNTSSADSTDKESDSASLVDSLDDPNSPRQSALTPRIKYDDKPVRGDLSALLPDNSNIPKELIPKMKPQKGSAFYVPIVQDKESTVNVKTVAEHLPERVKNRISKRQQIIEQKKNLKSKNDNLLDTNGNNQLDLLSLEPESISEGTWNSNNGTLKKVKKEKKVKNSVLQTLPSYKINSRGEYSMNPNTTLKVKRGLKQAKRKYVKNSESSESSVNIVPNRQSLWNHHAQLKTQAAAQPQLTNEFISDTALKNYVEKPLYNNRIEILEIMECVDQESDKSLYNQQHKNNTVRSKIPIPVQMSKPEIPQQRPHQLQVYQAYDLSRVPDYTPKTDQLIANILIDALNKPDMMEAKQDVPKILHHQVNEKRPPATVNKISPKRHTPPKFAIIPEERDRSLSSSSSEDKNKTIEYTKMESKEVEVQTQIENKNNNETEKRSVTDASSQTDLPVVTDPLLRIPEAYKGKASIAMMKDEDFSTIPKGWITFYMLKKSPGSPDSSTDEGTIPVDAATLTHSDVDKLDGFEMRQLRPVLIKKRIGKENFSELQEPNVTQSLQQHSNQLNNNLPLREGELKRAYSLEHINETITVTKKETYHHSSSESSITHSPNDNDTELKSSCPSLPIALPLRQGRRQSHRRGRYKTTQSQGTNATHTPGGWSVTVSGTNSYGQPAPDLEMRLKFPCPQTTSQSDSGLGEEQPRPPRRPFENQTTDNNEFHLPPAKPTQTKKYTVITRKQTTDLMDESIHSKSFQYLPDLIKTKNSKTAKRRDCSVPVTRNRGLSQSLPRHLPSATATGQCQNRSWMAPMQAVMSSSMSSMPPLAPFRQRALPGLVKPRQTLTSYRRFSLHHSSHLSPFRTLLPNAFSADSLNAEDILDLPECFPAILAVTGSQIAPELKPRVPTMSQKDLTRNHFSYGQHHA